MRQVRYSATFIHQLNTLLAQGETKFGARVTDQKRELVYDTIDHYLAQFPMKPRDPSIDLCMHAIADTPFIVIYDFDDAELRVFFIVHGHTDRAHIHRDAVEW
jgi:mRNA-degrading endonuclease RelE of RelBE toxin-antitoxin system